jgi:hypothetical protein
MFCIIVIFVEQPVPSNVLMSAEVLVFVCIPIAEDITFVTLDDDVLGGSIRLVYKRGV